MEFPVGKLEILIYRDLDDVVYKNGLLNKEKTNKELQGLIKLMVLKIQVKNPSLLVAFYHATYFILLDQLPASNCFVVIF